MNRKTGSPRRDFLRNAALTVGAATQASLGQTPEAPATPPAAPAPAAHPGAEIQYPRTFTGDHLAMIAFPLGGVAAGSLSLGGRGQLRDWEIFNRPDKGNRPPYAFPAIWVQRGKAKPVARVLESRILPPYEGAERPGLGERPRPEPAWRAPLSPASIPSRTSISTTDALPVKVSLEAFTPFIPHDPDDPACRWRSCATASTNPGASAAKVSIAWSIDNPMKVSRDEGGAATLHTERGRTTTGPRPALAGLVYSNPGSARRRPDAGQFRALRALDAARRPA